MKIWTRWWDAIWLLRPAFLRLRTFLWFAVCVAGLTVRSEKLGVTSIIRALGLKADFYDNLLDNFHSTAIPLGKLSRLWTKLVLRLFPGLIRVKGRLVLVGDGIKVSKQGRKMPAVKLLYQQSESNTKAQYIMGHSFQSVSILSQAANSVFAVPLVARIHEGIVHSNRDQRTLLDKMIALLESIAMAEPFYFIADAYYASHKVANGMLAQGNHLITRVRSNAVAYRLPVPKGSRKRGRPRKYGDKLALRSLFNETATMLVAISPVYGDKNITLRYAVTAVPLRI